jgi:tetratricopeptide (TPR) repeat protein
MAARVKWHRFKDAESRKDDATMAKLAKDLLESQSADMGIFLDVYPTLQKTADAEKVEAYFQRAYQRQKARVAEEPGAPVHNNDLAWLLARTGRRLDEAETLAEAAVKAKPEEAAYLDTLAEVKFRLGKIDEAIALEEKALKHMPGDKFMTEQLERFRAAKRPSD